MIRFLIFHDPKYFLFECLSTFGIFIVKFCGRVFLGFIESKFTAQPVISSRLYIAD